MKHNSGKTLRILAALVALLCLILAGSALAETELTRTVSVTDPWDLTSEQAAEQYMYQQLGWTSMMKPLSTLSKGTTVGDKLAKVPKAMYVAMKTQVQEIAAGRETSTVVVLSLEDLFPDGCTAKDLGIQGTLDDDNAPSAVMGYVSKVISALLADCPYDLYWYNKTAQTGIGYSGDGAVSGGKFVFHGDKLTISMPVSEDYATANAYELNLSFINKVKKAAAAAGKIVEDNAGKSDYAKLYAYKAAICNLVDYNYAALDPETPFGDPWQLINVFDGAPSTKVVCEGYSKAFQYLCDLSQFTAADTKAICVSGWMWATGDKEPGGHMWNIVTLNNTRYLADVTNSDHGSAGENGTLFLAGYAEHNDTQDYYRYVTGGSKDIYYSYKDKTLDTFAGNRTELEVSDTSYATVTASGQILGTYVSWRLYSTGVLSVSGTGAIPDYAHEGAPWYEYKNSIGSVVIEDGITGIGAYAFESCDHIASVQLPDSLTSIGESTFEGCSQLTSITIPRSVTNIGENALYNCIKLKNGGVWFGGTEAEWNTANHTDVSGATVHYMIASATWAWSIPTGRPDILILSGTGTVSLEEGETEYPWSSEAGYIKRVIVEATLDGLGDGVLSGFGDGLRVDFLAASRPTLTDDTFGTNTVVCRYFDKTTAPTSWTGGDSTKVSWIYLPFESGVGDDLELRYLSNKTWAVETRSATGDNYTLLDSAAQAKEMTFDDRWVFFETIPGSNDAEDWAVFSNLDAPTVLLISDRCMDAEAVFDFRSLTTGNLQYVETYARNMDLVVYAPTLPAGCDAPDLIVHEGVTVQFFGDVDELRLHTTQNSTPAVSVLASTVEGNPAAGDVRDITFYDASSDRPFKGTLTVAGTISRLTAHGQGSLYVPGISANGEPVEFSNLPTQIFEDFSQEAPVIKLISIPVEEGEEPAYESRLNINGVETVPAILSLDDLRFAYHFREDRVYFDLYPKEPDDAQALASIDNILAEGYNPGFTAADIIQSTDTDVYLEDSGTDETKKIILGDATKTDQIGIGSLYLQNCRVQIDLPVKFMMIWQGANETGPVYAEINSTIEDSGYILGRAGGQVTLGTNGLVKKGYWERRIRGMRFFGRVSGGETLVDNGQLRVLSSKNGQKIRSILPSDMAVTAAGSSEMPNDGSAYYASLDVDDATFAGVTGADQTALAAYLQNNGYTEQNIWAVVDVNVNAYPVTEGEGTVTSLSSLNAAVPVAIANEAGADAVVVRLHDGTAAALANQTSKEGVYQFNSDQFSKYILLSSKTYCPHENTAVRKLWEDGVQFTDDGSDDGHYVTGTLVTEEYCLNPDCGAVLNSTQREFNNEFYQHSYYGQDVTGQETVECTECGHVNTCEHELKYPGYTWLGAVPEYKDVGSNAYHTATGKALTYETCMSCGVRFNEQTVDDYESQVNHSYDENGKCLVCGHVNTCTHQNVTHATAMDESTVVYTSVDNEKHRATGSGVEYDYCEDCRIRFNEESNDNISEEYPHYYNNGVCTDCGHTCTHEYDTDHTCKYCHLMCPHSNAARVIDSTETRYELVSETEHRKITTVRFHTVCNDCGFVGEGEVSETKVTEAHVDENAPQGICDACGNSLTDPWIAEGNWDLDFDEEGVVLYIRGSGNMPDYAAGQAPWFDRVKNMSVDRVVISEGITRIGSNAFKGMGLSGYTLRAEFIDEDNGAVRTKPEIAADAFGSNVIYRYYNEDASWPDTAGWIYLPWYEAQTPGKLPVCYGPVEGEGNCWHIQQASGNIPLTLAQARELTYKYRDLGVLALPSGEDAKLYTESSGVPVLLSLYLQGEGTFTLTPATGADYLDGLELGSQGWTVSVTRSDNAFAASTVRVHSGTLVFNGDTEQLELKDSLDETGHVTFNGDIGELDFYGPQSGGLAFKGDVSVRGGVSNGFEYGSGQLEIDPVGIISLNDAVCTKFSLAGGQSAVPVIEDGVLVLTGANVEAYATKLSDYNLIYEFYDDKTILKLEPEDIGNACEINLTEEMAKQEKTFSPDDIIWGAATEVDVHFWTTPQTLTLNGAQDGTGFGNLFINATVGTVNLNCPVNTLSVAHDFTRGQNNALTLNINSTVGSASFEMSGRANLVTLGSNGKLTSEENEWSKYLFAKRTIPAVNGPCTLVKDGQLCILTAQENETMRAILPGDSEMSRAAGQDAVVSITDSGRNLMDDEEAALARIAGENASVSQVFDVFVYEAGENKLGNEMHQMTGGNARMAVENTSDGTAYVVRFHDYGGETGLLAEVVSKATADDALWFESDRFSTFAVVNGTPSACAGSHTLTAVAKVEPTCTLDGTPAHWKCTVCGALFADANGANPITALAVIEARGHQPVAIAEVPATCEHTGCRAHWKCSVCDELFFDTEAHRAGAVATEDALVIPLAPHTLSHVAKVYPTDTATGVGEHWACGVCGKVFLDKDGRTETTPEALVIPVTDQKCGENAYWSLEDGVLTVWGTGAMQQYSADTDNDQPPWYDQRADIQEVVILDGITSVGTDAFRDCGNLADVSIPSSVASIGDSAFAGCTSLTAVSISANVSSIGTAAFADCTSLDTITVAEGNTNYISEDGVLYNKTKTTLISFPGGKTGTFTVPDSVTEIRPNAFRGSAGLTMVTIPESVTTIGTNVFTNCTALTEIRYDGTAGISNLPTGAKVCRSVTVSDSIEHGTIAASAEWETAGETVILTASPDEGYQLAQATVTDRAGQPVSVSQNAFTMPESKVTVSGTFSATSAAAPTNVSVTGLSLKENYNEGNAVTVSATAAEGHTLSYQWYSNTVNANAGGTEIDGATGTSCEIQTGGTFGTQYYYCVVTATKTINGETAEATSPVAVVTITHDLTAHAANDATCTEPGNSAYWTCESCGKVFSDENGETEIGLDDTVIGALGHAYGTATYEWAEDNLSVTGKRVCGTCGHEETETANATGAVTTEPTCTTVGERTFTSGDFTNEAFTAQTKKVEIEAKGHAWGEPDYEWYGGFDRCTATRICGNNSEHKETEEAAITSAVKTPATCEEDGEMTYTATFTNTAFETQTKNGPIDPTGHSYGAPTYKWSRDYSTATATRTCGKCNNTETKEVNSESSITTAPTCEGKGIERHTAVFENPMGQEIYETQTIDVVLDALGHDPEHHDAKAATCTEAGWDAYDTCKRDGCTYTTKVEIPALGHDWNTEYTWADDNSTCTADAVCQRVNTHTQNETVESTSAVTTPATCEGMGKTTYTAAFTKDGFTTQTKEVENIPALGHKWNGRIKYTWSSDNTKVTGAEVCENDGRHTRNAETVSVTRTVTKQPTCTEKGTATYTPAAFVTYPAYSAEAKTGDIAALGHALRHHPAVAATTEATGTEQYWDCTRCGRLFSDAGGTRQITAAAVIPKLAPAAPPEPADKVEAFVTRCYRVILGREPEAAGLAYWVQNLKSGKEKASEIINGFVTSKEFQNKHLSDEDAVEILYNAMLGRGSDSGGKNYWLGILAGGNPFAAVINGFCTSKEFNNLCASYGIQPGSVPCGPLKPAKPVKNMTLIRAFVTRCYQVILSREPEAAGLEYWAKALANETEQASGIINGFVTSKEFTNKRLSNEDAVEVLYNAMLDRGSEPAGKEYWVKKLKAGEPFAAVINGFCTSKEFNNLCKQYGIQPGSVKVKATTVAGVADMAKTQKAGTEEKKTKHMSEEKLRAFIRKCYTLLLEREPGENEISYWTGSILSLEFPPAKAVHDMLLSAEFKQKTISNQELINRLYQIYTSRMPSEEESAYWISRLENGEALGSIADGFAQSAEFTRMLQGLWE